MLSEIRFYNVGEEYGAFFNFALYPIKLKGKVWPTSEHYFQSQKFEDKNYQDTIRKAPNPMKAAKLGRSRKVKIVRNWDNTKDNVMYDALKAKFTQHTELKSLLLSTDDAILIEHTENDSYWGDGGKSNTGLNKLGKLLMALRKN